MRKRKSISRHIRLDPVLADRLDKHATAVDLPASEVIRKALRVFLDGKGKS